MNTISDARSTATKHDLRTWCTIYCLGKEMNPSGVLSEGGFIWADPLMSRPFLPRSRATCYAALASGLGRHSHGFADFGSRATLSTALLVVAAVPAPKPGFRLRASSELGGPDVDKSRRPPHDRDGNTRSYGACCIGNP